MPKLCFIKCTLKIKAIRKLEIERKSLYLVKIASTKNVQQTVYQYYFRLSSLKEGKRNKNACPAC